LSVTGHARLQACAQLDDALSQRDKWEQSFQAAQRLLASPQSSTTTVTKQRKPRSWWVALALALLLVLALALLAVDRLTVSVDVGDAWVSRTGSPERSAASRANETAERE
jgi:cytochrome c-type biogenesis protein CcmH/NrfG